MKMRRHPFNGFGLLFFVVILVIASGDLFAGRVSTTYPDGNRHEVYSTTKDGVKQGTYQEYYPTGKKKIFATYKQGKKSGKFEEYYPTGKKKCTYSYKDDLRHGVCSEYDESGALVRESIYAAGRETYPRTKRILRESFKWIGRWKPTTAELQAIVAKQREIRDSIPARWRGGEVYSADRLAGLKQTMLYRCAVGLPYRHLRLDPMQCALAQAGADLCAKMGRLDHTPKNPGLPKAEYDFAYGGTSRSNLSMQSRRLNSIAGVNMFMDDSDPGNISRVGHRRWVLNPAMGMTGFGVSGGKWGAMYSFDNRGPQHEAYPKDYEYRFVAFPAAGLMPTQLFKSHFAWSCSVNTAEYTVAAKVSPTIRLISACDAQAGKLESKSTPLTLNYQTLNKGGFGGGPCVIFRPAGFKPAAGKCYLVELKGVTHTESGKTLKYTVEFF